MRELQPLKYHCALYWQNIVASYLATSFFELLNIRKETINILLIIMPKFIIIIYFYILILLIIFLFVHV